MFDHFYMTGVGMAGYVIIYVPLALFISFLIAILLRKLPKFLRWSIPLALAVFLISAPLLEIFYISYKASRLCRAHAGLKVYKTAQADGFRWDYDIEYFSKYGFSFVESGGGTPDNPIITRHTIEDGKPVATRVKQYASEYERKYKDPVVLYKYFSMESIMVVSIQTGEVYGELVRIDIYPSFIDSFFIGLTGTGSGFSPWHCGEEATPEYPKGIDINELILATLKPARKSAQGD
jgi:hypothetical protein